MEQLEQLRTMRDEARLRIAATADYKLATSLDALIADLEKVLGIDAKDNEETDDVSEDVEPEPLSSASVQHEEGEADETPSEDDKDAGVSDLTQALAEQLERETQSPHKSLAADDDVADEGDDGDEANPHATSGNGSTDVDEPEDLSEEDALIRAMRELDEDLARADLGGRTERSKTD